MNVVERLLMKSCLKKIDLQKQKKFKERLLRVQYSQEGYVP